MHLAVGVASPPPLSLQLSLFQTKWQTFLSRASRWRWRKRRGARRLLLAWRWRAQAQQLNYLYLLLRHLQTQPKSHTPSFQSRRSGESQIPQFQAPPSLSIVWNLSSIGYIQLVAIVIIIIIFIILKPSVNKSPSSLS